MKFIGKFEINILIVALIYNSFNIANYKSMGLNTELILLGFILSYFQSLLFWYIISINKYIYIFIGGLTFLITSLITYYSIVYKFLFNTEVCHAILHTEKREIDAFFDVYSIIFMFIFLLIFALLVYNRAKIKQLPLKKNQITMILILIFLGIILNLLQPKILKTALPYKYYEIIYHFLLQNHRFTNQVKSKTDLLDLADFKATQDNLTVVLIIGESMRGDHMQLNGYSKPTTPEMMKIRPFSFDALSCDIYTSSSVSCMLTRATPTELDISTKEKSLVSVFKGIGYGTHWISNHYSVNTDKRIGSITTEAEVIFFCHNDKTIDEADHDECLLPKYYESLNSTEGNNFIVLHIFGSHMRYDDRYPKEFEAFTPVCDKDTNIAQCSIDNLRNIYDNSILYTDYIYSQIIKPLENKRAIVFYVSDHGEALGEDNFYGRTKEHASSYNIAYTVWLSESVKNEVIKDNLLQNTHKQISHDTLFHSILDCSGVESTLIDLELSLCRNKLKEVVHNHKRQ